MVDQGYSKNPSKPCYIIIWQEFEKVVVIFSVVLYVQSDWQGNEKRLRACITVILSGNGVRRHDAKRSVLNLYSEKLAVPRCKSIYCFYKAVTKPI